jgi:hypothetical protein
MRFKKKIVLILQTKFLFLDFRKFIVILLVRLKRTVKKCEGKVKPKIIFSSIGISKHAYGVQVCEHKFSQCSSSDYSPCRTIDGSGMLLYSWGVLWLCGFFLQDCVCKSWAYFITQSPRLSVTHTLCLHFCLLVSRPSMGGIYILTC